MSMTKAEMQVSVDAREIITVITVSDSAKAKEWYTRLFGKGPDLEPFSWECRVQDWRSMGPGEEGDCETFELESSDRGARLVKGT